MKIITKDKKDYLQETQLVENDEEYFQMQLDSINRELEHLLKEKIKLEDKLKLFNK